jgi:hypothetical protein
MGKITHQARPANATIAAAAMLWPVFQHPQASGAHADPLAVPAGCQAGGQARQAMEDHQDVLVLSGTRTAIGKCGGGLAAVPPCDLAATAVREAVSGRAWSHPMSAMRSSAM